MSVPDYSRGFTEGMWAVIEGIRHRINQATEHGEGWDVDDLCHLLDRYEDQVKEIRGG